MAELPGPFEILEMQDQEQIHFRVHRWEIGETLIHPAYKPEGKWIRAMRLHVDQETKKFFPYYWDVTAQTLIAQLEPLLKSRTGPVWTFAVTKHGTGPRARFSVEVD